MEQILDRKQAPLAKEISSIHFIQPEIKALDNGIPCYIFNAGEQDLIRIEWVFKQVNWDENEPLNAYATNQLLNSGTEKYSAKEIMEKVDFYGAFLQMDYGLEYVTLSLYTLNKYLMEVMPYVQTCLFDCVFPEKEVATFVETQQQQLLVALEKNDFVARRKFNSLVFGSTIYGKEVPSEDYQKLNSAVLKQQYAKCYQAQNCEIFIAGRVDHQVFAMLNTFFGNWSSNESYTLNKFELAPVTAQNEYIEKPKSVQSAIRMGKTFINRVHPDFVGMQFTNCLFGGYFGSRLMANIREDKGYTYGIGSGMVSYKNTGAFFIATEVGVDVCTLTIQEIEKEMSILQNEKVLDSEIHLVKNYLLGSLLGSLENAFSHADKFKNIHFCQLDYSYYEHYIQTIKNISATEIQNLAQKYLNFDSMNQVIVGKK